MNHPLPRGKALDVLDIMIEEPNREFFGLELVRMSNKKLERNSIYMVLTRMVAFGFLEGRLETDEERQRDNIRGPKRRLYKITNYGKKMHAAHCAAEKVIRTGRAMKPAGAMN